MPSLRQPVAALEAFRQPKLFELPDSAFDGRLHDPKAFCNISSSLAVAFPDQLKGRCGPGSCRAALIEGSKTFSYRCQFFRPNLSLLPQSFAGVRARKVKCYPVVFAAPPFSEFGKQCCARVESGPPSILVRNFIWLERLNALDGEDPDRRPQ
ncbi:MAG: hypothetical protein WA782_06700 [Sulfitobacter sp.]